VLTVAAGFFSAPQRLFNVSPSCFYPKPEVESAVVQMEIGLHPDADFDAYMNTVKALFAMRRKTVKSNLRTVGLEPQQAEAVLKAAGIDENARAETLGVKDFIALSREMKKIY
jgi:16S rRNA (adenine1518-N6/adenine1519-N6)-dimethyltransferase